MSYTPDGYHQLDGSPFAEANCAPATGTDLADRDSVGKWRPSAPTIRALANDTSGGMSYSQVAPAVAKATAGEVVPQVITSTRAGLKALVAGGHGVGVSINCAVTISTPYHTGTYTGGHSIYVSAWRYNATLARDEFLVLDPGRGTVSNPLGPVWWPAWLLYKAAEARSGTTAIYLLVGRDTEGVSRTAVGGIARAGATVAASVRGSLSVGTAYSVVATVNGGQWTIGTHTGHGWHQIAWAGGTAYTAGGWLK